VYKEDALDEYRRNEVNPDDGALSFLAKLISKQPFFGTSEKSLWGRYTIENCNFSECHSCKKLCVWIGDKLVFPPSQTNFEPNADLPDSIKVDFAEVDKIVGTSPRGAAALLRLAIQKLCVELGESGKNIDQDIGSLVKKGLPADLQQALDVVRVIGNNAVHPGRIDMKDDSATAHTLFGLVNIIADRMISQPKRIAELYGDLPAKALAAIQKRDRGSAP